VNITLAALRERSADIPDLVEYFRRHFNMVYNRRVPPISASLMRLLQAYHWPGNIQNLMKRYVVLGTETCIANDLSEPVPGPFEIDIPEQGPVPLKKMTQRALRRLEREIILKVLQAHHWNRRRAAEVLKISYRALLYKIKDAGLSPSRSSIKDHRLEAGAPAAQGEAPAQENADPAPFLPEQKGSHA
jgi:two-component system response regulator AtoC